MESVGAGLDIVLAHLPFIKGICFYWGKLTGLVS